MMMISSASSARVAPAQRKSTARFSDNGRPMVHAHGLRRSTLTVTHGSRFEDAKAPVQTNAFNAFDVLRKTKARVTAREGVKLSALAVANASSADYGGAGTSPASGGSNAPNPVEKFMQGMRDRLSCDPNFFFKLGAEITIDEFITLFVNVAVRGNPLTWNVSEQLATACQMFTAAINDTLIVYFLAPTKASAGKKPEIASVFEKGDYTLAQRAMCFVNKAKFYAAIGAVSCTISMFLALALGGNIGGFTHEVLFRSIATGGLHMGLSANTRYQIVNGIERVCYDKLPTNVAKSASVAVRMGNNFLGARLWMLMAQFTGLS